MQINIRIIRPVIICEGACKSYVLHDQIDIQVINKIINNILLVLPLLQLVFLELTMFYGQKMILPILMESGEMKRILNNYFLWFFNEFIISSHIESKSYCNLNPQSFAATEPSVSSGQEFAYSCLLSGT